MVTMSNVGANLQEILLLTPNSNLEASKLVKLLKKYPNIQYSISMQRR